MVDASAQQQVTIKSLALCFSLYKITAPVQIYSAPMATLTTLQQQIYDLIRQTSVDWLFGSFIELAAEANRKNSAISIEREDPHEFSFQNARMAGSIIRISLGVRRITVEAGWTRLPAHGFMRSGALAAARISHFGMPKAGADLMLVRDGEVPVWNCLDGLPFDSQKIAEHFAVFLGD